MENEVRLAKITIDERVIKEVKETVDNLNKINAESILPTLSEKDKTHLKTKFVNGKLTNQVQKLTMKMFTEGALNYFTKHKIDPRFFDDSDSLANQVVRLRNQIFSFLQVQERQYLIPLNTNLAELKLKDAVQLMNENKYSTRQILAYLVSFTNLYFETLDMEKAEIEQLKSRLDLFYQATLRQLEEQP
ncbi:MULTISPECIES: hypothetical protein [Emticicia]|uniref:hypothetical protein n=1 Tax=Emticicia TaxID=312278 RepID=UPI0007D89C1D|nr:MULTISPECIES: hypothetical protein [Emticicia]